MVAHKVVYHLLGALSAVGSEESTEIININSGLTLGEVICGW